jgi:hypothetical protein
MLPRKNFIVNPKLHLSDVLYRIEDKFIRNIRNLPDSNRRNSFPYLSSDTYFFLCDKALDQSTNIICHSKKNSFSSLYINGNLFHEQGNVIMERLREENSIYEVIVVGDTDLSPSQANLLELKNYAKQVFCVNLVENFDNSIRAMPLGLESQRYRSAGQIRDFSRVINFAAENREIGLLVAWNDATNIQIRSRARKELANLPFTTQVTKRITARSIHLMMRHSLFVACPRGNGIDTHRFWESVYLGAIPIILRTDKIPSYDIAPHVVIDSWLELNQYTYQKLMVLYCEKSSELMSFRNTSISFLEEIFGGLK